MVIDNSPVIGCETCNTTAGRMGCPAHRLYKWHLTGTEAVKHIPIYANKAEMIPNREHWAIIKSVSIYVPGDERSVQAPGHGYPAHYEESVSYAAYLDEDEFKKALAEAYRGGSSFQVRGIHVDKTYTVKVVAEVSEAK